MGCGVGLYEDTERTSKHPVEAFRGQYFETSLQYSPESWHMTMLQLQIPGRIETARCSSSIHVPTSWSPLKQRGASNQETTALRDNHRCCKSHYYAPAFR